MAAIRMMFSWLTEKGILAINPAREVKTPKFSRTEGKTPGVQYGRSPEGSAIHRYISSNSGSVLAI
jgi:hypothetical protein